MCWSVRVLCNEKQNHVGIGTQRVVGSSPSQPHPWTVVIGPVIRGGFADPWVVGSSPSRQISPPCFGRQRVVGSSPSQPGPAVDAVGLAGCRLKSIPASPPPTVMTGVPCLAMRTALSAKRWERSLVLPPKFPPLSRTPAGCRLESIPAGSSMFLCVWKASGS